MKRVGLLITLLLVAACGTNQSSSTTSIAVSTTESPTASVTYSTREIGTVDSPVDLTERSPDDPWMYVVSQSGIIQKWSRDGKTRETILDISDVTSVGGERGLLGLAFRNVDNQWQAFLNRTNTSGDTEITLLLVNADGTFSSTQSPGTLILRVPQPYSNHNGGAVLVGPDNMLYIFMGDGGSANDPDRYAQNMDSLLGKILRIDPLVKGGYDIPADNPFLTSPRPEIWSIGVRNPWRPTFDSYGGLWIADVGQNEWEEVHALPASETSLAGRGANLGWSAFEGTRRFNDDVTAPNALTPVFEYPHSDGRCSISGGAVGNNTSTPSRAGWYFFSDYCSGDVRAILTDGATTVAEEEVVNDMGNVTAVRSTRDSIYILSADGKVRELRVMRS